MTAAGYALRCEDLRKSFPAAGDALRRIPALDAFTATAARGSVTGIVGPDGAGKTTLLRLAAGLLVPDSGQIEVLGIDVVQEPSRVQAQIGFMPQRFGLYEDLTVAENLDLYADLHGVPEGERPGRRQELLQMTALGPFTGRLAGALSGGMKQKLGLACTLLSRPEMLLLDEPTVGVDPVSRRELWNIINRLVGSHGLSVVLSTSYLDEAERCAEVIVMHQGKVRAQGQPGRLRAPAEGRVFTVTHPDLGRRALQERLSDAPEAVDLVPQGERLRVVTADGRVEHLAAKVPGARFVPAPARFEDAFMLLLARQPAEGDFSKRFEAPPSRAGRNADEVISVDNLKRRFGEFYAVKGVSFAVKRGEVFGLLGANGAGKSTTFRMLCGLLPITSGRALVAGLDLAHAAAAARGRIGYMAQRFSLYGDLSVRENLMFFGAVYGLHGRTRRERCAAALAQFDLERYADTSAGLLPLGYTQRLALAAALLHRPEILFLDEPTSGVDPLARREFWQRIAALAHSGVTVLVTTHFMEEAEYCDRLVLIDAGEILAEGSPKELQERVRRGAHEEPTMEDAFVRLLEARGQGGAA